MAERKYNEYIPFDRPKLPRNKYGIVYGDNTIVGSGSVFGASSSEYGSEASYIGDALANIEIFTGATRSENGTKGIVPAPLAGQDQSFLKGDGKWTRIPAYEWFTEFPESAGLEKSGLQLNGDLNVTDTITTVNLEVTGAAHFWELIIDEVKAQGGQVLVSPSMFHVDYKGEIVQYPIFSAEQDNPLREMMKSRPDIASILQANGIEYIRCIRLYQKCDDGNRTIKNECEVGDMMRCRSFNIKKGVHFNVSNSDYWTFVCNRDVDGKIINDDGIEELVTFTDEDGKTFDAFFIDLAFTLRTADGHNFPIGTILYSDGREPVYPKGWEEIFGPYVDMLKQYSQETLDGTTEITPEYYENEEWTNIQENVIKIRGLDDQFTEITGKKSSDSWSSNENNLNTGNRGFNKILDEDEGLDTDDVNLLGQMSVNGQIPTVPQSNPSGQEETEATLQTRAILGNDDKFVPGLNVDYIKKNKITLRKDVQVIREEGFVVADPVYDNEGRVIYNVGDIIEPGETTLENVNVIVNPTNTDLEYVPESGIPEAIDPESTEAIEINTDTVDTNTNMNRNPNNYIDMDYSKKTEWQFGYTSDYTEFRIKEGDSLACLGHLFESTRQNAIVLSSNNPIDSELEPPAIAQYSHIDEFGLYISKYRQTAIAANGNEFIGSFLVNYNNTFVDINERINMMIMDVKTGLESVGIHLDGENSTITLVGSVDLKQHSQDSYDTLNLYDNLGVKRMEIMPFDIPVLGSADSQVDKSKFIFNTINERKNATSEYIKYYSTKNWKDGKLFHYTWIYEYTLDKFNVKLSTSTSLGYLEEGYKLDLTDLQLKIKTDVLLGGITAPTNRGFNKQSVTGLHYKLWKDGQYVMKQGDLDFTPFITDTVFNVYCSDVFPQTDPNDPTTGIYTIPVLGNGTYSLEVTVSFNVYAYTRCGDDYNNYYYSVNCEMSGSVASETTRVIPENPNIKNPGYKFTIGTNGFNVVIDNSKHFYVANDGFNIQWGANTYISFDDTKGLQIRRDTQEVNKIGNTFSSNVQLGTNYETVYCVRRDQSYTVTLPHASDFGLWRTITILGWLNITEQMTVAELTVAAYTGDSIEFQVWQDGELQSLVFGNDTKIYQALTLMSTGNNTWRVISYC